MTEEIPLSPRQRFRALLEDLTAEHPEMGAGEIADLVARTLPEDDRQLVSDFLSSEARTILAFEIRMQHAQTRNGIFSTINIHNAEAPPVANLSERRRETLYDRIEAWREYVPGEKRSRALLDMNRPSLLDSANYDLAKTFHFGFKALLKQRLAEKLPDENTTVGQAFTTEDIVDITESVKKEMGRGNFRLKLKPFRPLSSRTGIQSKVDGRNSSQPPGG